LAAAAIATMYGRQRSAAGAVVVSCKTGACLEKITMCEDVPGSPESAAFRAALEVVRAAEPAVADAISAELASQREQLKLIASENYASSAVLLAMGNWLSDRYAEGTAGRRVYAGYQHVDTVEELAAGHARELFGMPYAYVEPHSGIDANLVAFWAVLIDAVLSSTRPAATASGPASKAHYSLDAAVASKIAGQAAEILARYPLYPSVQLG
jgi:glycine/serine hydroxymethyltransferase